MAATITEFLSIKEECETSYEGLLEQTNIHRRANIFYIYPPSGPNRIKCHFPPEIYNKALDAIGRKVMVEGLAKYRTLANFPHEIEVRDIEVYPAEDELPTFEYLRGIESGMTGEKLSEEYIAGLRDEWV